jgi:hypothetical protein
MEQITGITYEMKEKKKSVVGPCQWNTSRCKCNFMLPSIVSLYELHSISCTLRKILIFPKVGEA